MALLRLLSIPSTSQFSTRQQFFFSPTPFKPSPQLISFSTSPFSLSLNLNSQTPNQFLPFCLSSTTQAAEAPITIDTSDTPQQPQEVQQVVDEASRTRLIAMNVPWSLTMDEVRSLFEKYGTIVDLELSMYNKTTNRGLAFVTMSSHEEAQMALSSLQSYVIEDRTLVLDWAKPRKAKPTPPPRKEISTSPQNEKPSSTQQTIFNLFVSNLPYQARTKDLKDFFVAENANVVSAVVIFKPQSGSAGYGFVSFNTQEEANAAVEAFQGKEFMGRPLRVERSKRFAKSRTKKVIKSGDATLASIPKAEEPAKMDPVVEEPAKVDPVVEEPAKVDDA